MRTHPEPRGPRRRSLWERGRAATIALTALGLLACVLSSTACSSRERGGAEGGASAAATPSRSKEPASPRETEREVTDEEMGGWTRVGRTQWLLGEALSNQRTFETAELLQEARRFAGQIVKLEAPARFCEGRLLVGSEGEGQLIAVSEQKGLERARRQRLAGKIVVEGKLVVEPKRVEAAAGPCEAGRKARGLVEIHSLLIRLER
jgi:hypothetical protein